MKAGAQVFSAADEKAAAHFTQVCSAENFSTLYYKFTINIAFDIQGDGLNQSAHLSSSKG